MIFFFICLSVAQHLIIDFGSYRTKAARFSRNEHPSIATNLFSKRSTPTFIAMRGNKRINYEYGDLLSQQEASQLEPFIGEEAVNILNTRQYMGTGFLPLFVDASDDFLNNFTSRFYLSKEAARLGSNDFLPLFFKQYINELKSQLHYDDSINSVTIIVPAHFSIVQREIIKQAIEVAGYKNVDIIDDVDAVIKYYGFTRANQIGRNPLYSLFVDVGAYKTEVYLVNFTSSGNKIIRAERLAYHWADCGGAHLTQAIAEYFINSLRFKCTQSEKRRIFEASEKLKKDLTVVNSASVTVEGINGQDRIFTLNRNQLNNMNKKNVYIIKELIFKVLNDFHVDEINVIGGGVRVISTKEAIESIKIRVKKQMDFDETVVFGGAYLMQQYKGFNNVEFVDIYNEYPIYSLDILSPFEKQCAMIRGVKPTLTKYFTQPTKIFQFSYRLNETPHLKTHVFSYHLPVETSQLAMKLSKSTGELISLKGPRSRKVKFQKKIILPVITEAYYAIVKANKERNTQISVLNALEYSCYTTLQNLQTNQVFIDHTNTIQKTQLQEAAQSIQDWCLEKGNQASITEIQNQQKKLDTLLQPVEERIKDTNEIDEWLAAFLQALEIGQMTLKNKSISAQNRKQLQRAIDINEKWYQENSKKQFYLWEKRPIRPKELREKTSAILTLSNNANGKSSHSPVLAEESDEIYKQLNSYL